MIPAGQCWYFVRVWRLAVAILSDLTTLERFQEKFDKAVALSGQAVVEFVSWVRGAQYPLKKFLEKILEEDSSMFLLPPLLGIVYNYLSPPLQADITQELLLMI